MNSEQHYMSKVPVKLVLLFLANLILIIALEVLLVYRYPSQLTEGNLASFDSTYEGSTIVSSEDVGRLHVYLVKTENGKLHLIPACAHGIVWGRSRIYRDQIAVIPADAEETTVTVKTGLFHSSAVTVTQDENSGIYAADIRNGLVSSAKELSSGYLLVAVLLELTELFVIYKVKGTI